ncbi:MAG: hypothetical protein H7308_12670 [Chthonomonadaceae bacterium]|nr:hypothetical protein [Chthonomonadaceae bacterium]
MILTHFLVNEGEIVERKSVDVTTFSPETLAIAKHILPLFREKDAEGRRLSGLEYERCLAKMSNSGTGGAIPMLGELVTEYPEERLQEMERLQFNTQPELFAENTFPVSLGLSPTRNALLSIHDDSDYCFCLWYGGKAILVNVVSPKTTNVAPFVERALLKRVRLDLADLTELIERATGTTLSPEHLATINLTELHKKQTDTKPLASEIVAGSPALVSVFLTDAAEIEAETQEKMLQFSRSLAFAILERTERDRTNSN